MPALQGVAPRTSTEIGSRQASNLKPSVASSEAVRRKNTTLATIGLAVVFALGLAFNTWVAVCNMLHLGVDFNQFYAASHLAGTGHLYDWDALRKIEVEHGFEVPTARLPVVAYGHKLLGSLPYAVARSIWIAGSIAALLVFALVWPGARRLLMFAALAWSVPLTLVLIFGQDVPFWLMFFAVALLLLERKRPWLAGVAFSLCICKFHLALGIPVLLVAQKRWKTLIAGAVAVVVWIASSFLIEGPSWPIRYAQILHMPALSPAAVRMPNLHGLASYLPWPQAAELAVAVAIVLLLWKACRGTVDLGTAGAAAAACGLLLGNHAYAGDCALLIPLAVLTLQRQGLPAWLEVWAILLLSSVPVVLLVAQISLPGQALIVGFVVAAIIVGMTKPLGRTALAA